MARNEHGIEVALPGATAPIRLDVRSFDGRNEDGLRYWNVKTAIKVSLDCVMAFTPRKRATAIAEAPLGSELAEDDGYVIKGIASSTSLDWYGTEMSLECLQDQAEQFRAGVPYVPGHWDDEWHEVMGYSCGADIYEASVEDPADASEQGFVLCVEVKLTKGDEYAEKMITRLDRGDKIGQSIGAWFTDVRIVADDDGNVTRVIIMRAKLDHLAATRRPANPDAWIESLRSALLEGLDTANRSVETTAQDLINGSIPQLHLTSTAHRDVRTVDASESDGKVRYTIKVGERALRSIDAPPVVRTTGTATTAAAEPVAAIATPAPETKTTTATPEAEPALLTVDPVLAEVLELREKHQLDEESAQILQSARAKVRANKEAERLAAISIDVTEAEGRASAPDAVSTTTDDQEVDMTPEQIAALSQGIAAALGPKLDVLSASVEALAGRSAPATASAAAPTPEPEAVRAAPVVDARVAELEARLADAESTVRAYAAAGQRRGPSALFQAPTSLDAGNWWTDGAKRAKEQGLTALAAVHTPEFCARAQGKYGYPGKGIEQAREMIADDLRAVIEAAVIDGVIREPEERVAANWS